MSERLQCGLSLVAALLALLAAGPGAAALLLVPEQHASIASALATASNGDSVSIAPGIYYEHDLVWPLGVSIFGRTSNPSGVVIDAQYQGRVLSGENLSSLDELAYLTLRNGDAAWWPGSGLMVTGDPLLHNLIIEDCRNSGRGTGLFVQGGATITDCVLRNNRSTAPDTDGGGAWLDGYNSAHSIHVRNVEVYGNEADYGSGLYVNSEYAYLDGLYCHDNLGTGLVAYDGDIYGSGPTIENSLFVNNPGSGVSFDASVVIRNCTFVGNGTAGYWYGAIACWSTWDYPHHPTISQCIVANNNGGGISWYDPSPWTIACNDVFGNAYADYINLPNLTGQNGNISVDPQFCARGGSTYGLQSDSPCAPENNDCGLLMGAFGVACGNTGTRDTSWGAIKALY